MAHKETEQLVKRLRKQGFHVKRTKKGHYAVKKGEGKTVFMPTTPSDTRGLHRVHRKLKSIGFDKGA